MWQRQLANILMTGMVMWSLVGCLSGGQSTVDSHMIQGSDMNKVKITVSIDEAHINQIQEVTDQLGATGMDIKQTMPTIGVVIGSVQSEKIPSLYKVEGVQNVEPERTYQLAPPNSDVQ